MNPSIRIDTYETRLTSSNALDLFRDYEIIVGKWLAAMLLYVSMLALALISILTLFAYGKPDWRPLSVGFLGLILQGGCLLAVCEFVSACTKNQIVAGVAGFGISLLLWVMDWVSSFDSSPLYRVISYLSVTSHYESFSKGVLDSKDAIYYLSMIALGLFLTSRAMESIRWRA